MRCHFCNGYADDWIELKHPEVWIVWHVCEYHADRLAEALEERFGVDVKPR